MNQVTRTPENYTHSSKQSKYFILQALLRTKTFRVHSPLVSSQLNQLPPLLSDPEVKSSYVYVSSTPSCRAHVNWRPNLVGRHGAETNCRPPTNQWRLRSLLLQSSRPTLIPASNPPVAETTLLHKISIIAEPAK